MPKSSAKALTQEELKRLLDYCPETGEFTWKVRRALWIPIGTIAGYKSKAGYVQIRIYQTTYYAHRLAFLYMTGSLPDAFVDHINGDTSDSRWSNLRLVNSQENTQNAAISKNNSSGVLGVTWDKRKMKWLARIMVNRKEHFLGYFTELTEAAFARKQAEQFYGFHPNHGRNAICP